MERHLVMPTPAQQLMPHRRQFVTSSPTRRSMGSTGDDLLFRLAPTCAVDSLLDPYGTLKACLELATRSELDFAMDVALASRSIYDWLDEVMDWPWPLPSKNSNGFAIFPSGLRSLQECASLESAAKMENCYVGCLPAKDVIAYENRIDEILQELDELALDEIKSQVLLEHFAPVSSPDSPFSPLSTNTTTSQFHRLSGYAAVLAAIVLQALPPLSRLTRLLGLWSLRLAVLRRVPAFFTSLHGAEIALRSAWNAIGMTSQCLPPETPKTPLHVNTSLSRSDFLVMKSVVEHKVSVPGYLLDYMLDQLEGLDDTLPDKWLSQVETVEQDYAEWVFACEKKIRQAEYGKIAQEHARQKAALNSTQVSSTNSSPLPSLRVTDVGTHNSRSVSMATISSEGDGELSLIDLPEEVGGSSTALALDSSINVGRDVGLAPSGHEDADFLSLVEGGRITLRRGSYSSSDEAQAGHVITDSPIRLESSVILQSSPALPPMKAYKPDMDDTFTLESSPVPPMRTTTRTIRAKSVPSRDALPSSSGLNSSMMLDQSILDESFVKDLEVTKTIKGPTMPASSDEQFQQQISEILEHIPARITLSSEPKKPIDLNPPDLNLPKLRKKMSRDPGLRSLSSLSSRSQTPSFTLAPAERNSRARRLGQQEIKVYHLSRSTGEAPIKLFIRLVGGNGERVMVRVGGGWADLGEYLREYASHHGRRSGAQIQVHGLNSNGTASRHPATSSPPSRPHSAMEYSPMTPTHGVGRRPRKYSMAADHPPLPRIPSAYSSNHPNANPSDANPPTIPAGSRSSSGSYEANGSPIAPAAVPGRPMLGLAGPKAKQMPMTEENQAWVKSVTDRVRIASGEFRAVASSDGPAAAGNSASTTTGKSAATSAAAPEVGNGRFGEMGKVGGTKRLFRRG
ncbi:GAS2 domain containing protein [Ceratocystis lukuohia]|uniref:GAS2 domain containing protein n=1 Tax=Ceratocystis lukuohia TaxID=2019550 RepID=A0ABR4MHU5_9PEZI